MKILVKAHVNTSAEHAWAVYTQPQHIVNWNFASDDWCCPSADYDVRVGGRFTSRMEAKDGSMGFDFGGSFTHVVPMQALDYRMDDNREAAVRFTQKGQGVNVTVEFDAETTHSAEMQRGGWQAILDNYARYAEAQA
ncbi:SRPBCC domain-containing protein [Bowmanella sp. JS7-9]|uniref:SRPBCC domain-containing protein n=1 Tax=Pseudobowmanella zhangzhouensis TaxID=1537679 RepID=A0ABW1XI11_9ALTE|nr:SRPBCC domain-containing protein [Bowmanella sp. JS7-9]TBX25798.1 hypothetical protein TK45_03720 [Bowmanella sp. JS7-9]